MVDVRRIFVGSSTEALGTARLVAEVIERAGMRPVVWDTVFPAGDILLERIEELPRTVDGAVLLVTPDVACERRGERFRAPVANVVFEYGYLAARLTRGRVAICGFEGAEIPSDLEGMTVVRAGPYRSGDAPPPLPERAVAGLGGWLERLPRLAAEVPPVSRVHGYSGTWKVQNRFSLWRGMEMGESDSVYFDGTTFLLLSPGGERGSGFQTGTLFVFAGGYEARYEMENEILMATVDREGTLRLHVGVRRRRLAAEVGEPPDPRFRGELANRDFDLVLRPVPGEPRTLAGTHEYSRANRIHQKAEESYTHLGLLGS